jgi:hypothetical protein
VFHDLHYDTDLPTDDSVDPGDRAFNEKWNKVRKLRQFQEIGETNWSQCPACILTRWWYVGNSFSYVYDYYLVLFKFTQLVIHAFPSNNAKNKAASDLQSMLMDPYFYSDVCLVRCFHHQYFNDHMRWFMRSDDLTNKCGFQSHQMVVRYYLMERELESLMEDVDHITDPNLLFNCFGAFHASLSITDSNGNKLVDNVEHKAKCRGFVQESIVMLHKHFSRWLSPKLLPAALMAEKPLADVVATVVAGNIPTKYPPQPSWESDPDGCREWESKYIFRSRVHGMSNFILPKFEQWLRDKVNEHWQQEHPLDGNNTKPTYAMTTVMMAKLMLTSNVDTRKWEHLLVKKLWRTYLALASNTQFVERGVKEGTLCGSTGRKEEQRSAYAINRSAMVHCDAISGESTPTQRIEALMDNVEHALKRKDRVMEVFGDDYPAVFEEAKSHMYGKGHFRQEREELLTGTTLARSMVNRATENVRQRQTGRTMTAANLGIIQYSHLKATKHTNDIVIELQKRGYNDVYKPQPPQQEEQQQDGTKKRKRTARPKLKTFTVLKNELKRLEQERVAQEFPNDESRIKAAEKGFEKLSDAEFQLDQW